MTEGQSATGWKKAAGPTVEGIGAGLAYRTGLQYPFVLTLGRVFRLSSSSTFYSASSVHFSIRLIHTAFGICISQILPMWKCDQEGRETTH